MRTLLTILALCAPALALAEDPWADESDDSANPEEAPAPAQPADDAPERADDDVLGEIQRVLEEVRLAEEAAAELSPPAATGPVSPSGQVPVDRAGGTAAPAMRAGTDRQLPVARELSWGQQRGGMGLRTYGAAYGAFVGGSTGYLIGETLEESEGDHVTQGPIAGSLVGLGIGIGTAALLDSKLDVTNDDIVLISSTTTLGGYAGGELGRMLIPVGDDGDVERIQAARLAGSMIGAGIGFATRDEPPAASVGRVDAAALIGWQTGSGINDMVGWRVQKDRRPRAAVALGTTAAFTGTAAAAEALGFQGFDPAATSVSISHGLWLGLMAPLLVDGHPDANIRLGAARAGLGVGYLAALGTSALGGVSPKSAGLQGAGIAIGNALGAGIPMSIGADRHPRAVVAPALLGGIAGQTLGAVVAPYYDLTPNDAYLLSTLGAWSAYQTAGWTIFASQTQQKPMQPLGYALTAAGGSTLLTLGIAPLIDVDAAGSIALLSAGGWGTWYGGWGGTLGKLDADKQWLVMLATGNATLLAGAIAEGAGFKPTWRDVGVVDGFGLVGAAAGGMFGVIFLYDADNWDPMVWSVLAGSTVGLATGVVIASLPSNNHDAESAAMWEPPSLELRGRNGGLQPGLTASPYMGDDGRAGAFVELTLRETK